MSSIQAISNVAFMGLGTMGMLMAGRLLDSGIAVNGYDVDPAATATLEDAGGTASASPAQAAADASIVLLMVTTAEEVMSVLFAPRTGAVHGLRENATIIVILNSTVQPTVPQDVRHRLDSEFRRSDVVVLDAPVTGGMKDAQDGMLSIMVSAARADHLERSDVKDVLARITQKVYHISGPLGSALKVKVLNQVLCGIHIVAAAEIMGLAAVMGMDTRRFYESVASPGVELGRKKNCWSWMFEDRVPRMLDYKLPMESAMSNILRDVGAVNKEAERAGVRLSLYKASQVVYERAVKLGLQEADDSAVFQVCFRYDTDQGSERTKTLQMVSEMGGLYPEDEAGRLAGLLGDALAAVHTMAAYEALVLAEGMHMCRTLKQCKQWIEILGSAAAGSMVFIKGMPRIFESETHGTGSLELLVPRREGLLESLVSRDPGCCRRGLAERADV
jgi:3-hydroxyisobutyrate dehydrogenase